MPHQRESAGKDERHDAGREQRPSERRLIGHTIDTSRKPINPGRVVLRSREAPLRERSASAVSE